MRARVSPRHPPRSRIRSSMSREAGFAVALLRAGGEPTVLTVQVSLFATSGEYWLDVAFIDVAPARAL